MNNVLDFGAKGDGKTLDTAAIQAAVDAGGIVYFPAGVYRSGTIYLKSNGGLYLAPGATITASHDKGDYNADDFCPQNEVFSEEWVTGAHLIVAVEQENVTIEGEGTIDGQGNYWMNENNVYSEWDGFTYKPNPERPAQMLYFCECKNVRVKDVNIVNAPYWHLFFHGCEGVACRGLTIRGDRPRWTNDGIDVDCSENVVISDCVIDVGDDALTLRANKKVLRRRDCTKNVTVTNCVLRSHNDYGIRIGVGAGVIRDCVLSDSIVEGYHYGGIAVQSVWSDATKYGTTIENILFNNLIIKSPHPLELFVSRSKKELPNECGVKNLRFNNLSILSKGESIIRGADEKHPIQNVFLSNVTVDCGEYKEAPEKTFSISYAENVEMQNLRFVGTDSEASEREIQKRTTVEYSRRVLLNKE